MVFSPTQEVKEEELTVVSNGRLTEVSFEQQLKTKISVVVTFGRLTVVSATLMEDISTQFFCNRQTDRGEF